MPAIPRLSFDKPIRITTRPGQQRSDRRLRPAVVPTRKGPYHGIQPRLHPSTPDDLQLFLADVSRMLWRLTWDLKAQETRLLSPALHRAAQDLQTALHAEQKPNGWCKGTRVRVAKPFDACRCPIPVAGTQGRVDRIMHNLYGWWVCVAFTAQFTDVDGTTWFPDAGRPIVIYFKEDEIERLRPPTSRH